MNRLPLAPFALLAALGLALGVLAGLLRLGWSVPFAPGLHGPLMLVGFVGAIVSLERAAALGRPWGLLAPVLQSAGVLMAFAGVPVGVAGRVAFSGAVVAVISFGPLLARTRRPPAHLIALAAGALMLLPGHALWALGRPVHASVPWWIAFVVVSVAAERWERSRITGLTRGAAALLACCLALVVAGAFVPLFDIRWGLRPLAPGLLATATWLLLHDVSWKGLASGGERRHVAACTLAGHLWLLIAGLLAAWRGVAVVGPDWDAVLHALFVGFLFSMIFAHAPIVLSPLLGLKLRWTPAFHLPHALLHLSLLMRLSGDLLREFEIRRWGGLLNAVALVLFGALVALRARKPKAES
jgi:hypothetical protein